MSLIGKEWRMPLSHVSSLANWCFDGIENFNCVVCWNLNVARRNIVSFRRADTSKACLAKKRRTVPWLLSCVKIFSCFLWRINRFLTNFPLEKFLDIGHSGQFLQSLKMAFFLKLTTISPFNRLHYNWRNWMLIIDILVFQCNGRLLSGMLALLFFQRRNLMNLLYESSYCWF